MLPLPPPAARPALLLSSPPLFGPPPPPPRPANPVPPGVPRHQKAPPFAFPHHRPAIKIRPQPAVRPLGDPAVGALGVDAAQQEAELTVHPSPRGAHRAFVARSEENGVLLASRGRASGRDFQGSKVDLEPER